MAAMSNAIVKNINITFRIAGIEALPWVQVDKSTHFTPPNVNAKPSLHSAHKNPCLSNKHWSSLDSGYRQKPT